MRGVLLTQLRYDNYLHLDRASFPQPASILSTAWYPTASSSDPASYCFVAAVRNGPVKLFDASDGRLRASYKIIDHQERFIAPHCMGFNMHMNRLYCGFENAIEVFDVHYPGEGTRLYTVPTKKSRDGLRGIVSSLAFAPDWSGLYAAGSFSGAIALYTEDAGAQAQGWLGGVEGGVTQIRFNPMQSHIVYAGFRRTPTIARWDLRNPSGPVALYDRGTIETNQRLHFDISPDGRWVIAGDEAGKISIFDALGDRGCMSSANAHKDSVGAVTFHPTRPFVVSTSGSRHFTYPELVSSDSSGESDMEVEIIVSGVQRPVVRRRRGPSTMDNSVKLWTYGEPQC
ncbi:hypothetical protein CTheo_4800 [Ceratobasidium theobromae]|uniref:Guanyl nucleotide binding protein n=1 Tax=Ceratobasidium theobromae TaxID=1582974 RepID=A0A5N5QJV0_9AGAM|nr:hypothetical protein CTheo_4800 [Ceratobasidium theobromae]